MKIPIRIVNRFQLIIFCNSTFCSSFHNVFERSVDSLLYLISIYHQGYLFINLNKSKALKYPLGTFEGFMICFIIINQLYNRQG